MWDNDPCSLLTRLIDVADRALTRSNAVDREALEALSRAIEPKKHITCIGDEATMLITALRAMRGRHDRWAMIAGALLPMVREALGRGLEERRAAAGRADPDAQPNYGGRRL